MAKTLLINAVDRTSVWRPWSGEMSPDFVLQEMAYGGAVGAGYVNIDDSGGAITVPAMKAVTMDESLASPTRVFTGYVNARHIRRGPFAAATDRQWGTDLDDVNALWDDQILRSTDSANRGAETDYARMSWLISTGALGAATAGTTVPSGANVNMDAFDYRGSHPRDVANDCAQASGKNYFLYYTTALFVFYALASGSTFSSTLQISDDSTDVDSSTTFAPIIHGDSLTRVPDKVFSGVRLRYKAGAVYVTNATTASTYRVHEAALTYMKVKTSAKATAQAQQWLDSSTVETDNLPDIEIIVPAANVNDIRAGQRMKVKLRHAGVSTLTYFRVKSRDVMPENDVSYRIRLSFMDDVRVTSFVPSVTVDDVQSNATDTDATVIIDENGITVTNGAVTITNAGGTTTFDGTQETFQIAASGTIAIGPNKKVQSIYVTVRVSTGLTYDPLVIGSFFPKAYNDGDWKVALPYMDVGKSGLVLNQYVLRGRNIATNKTDVRAHMFTTKPPSPAVTYRYYVLSKRSI